MAGLQNLQQEFMNIPIITRGYTAACVLTTLAVVSPIIACHHLLSHCTRLFCGQQLDLASPFQLYFNPQLIFSKYQVCVLSY